MVLLVQRDPCRHALAQEQNQRLARGLEWSVMFAHRLVLSELVRFFDDHQLTCELHDSISYSTMAQIIVSILAVIGDADAAAALDKRKLTKHVKDFVN